VYQSRVHEFEELLVIWHGLQQSAVNSASDGERVLEPAYGPKDIFSSGSMLTELLKQCSKFVVFVFSNRLTIHKVII